LSSDWLWPDLPDLPHGSILFFMVCAFWVLDFARFPLYPYTGNLATGNPDP